MQRNDNRKRIYYLMQHVFNMDELHELYAELGIDKDNVPQPANKAAYTRYLIDSIARNSHQNDLLNLLRTKRPTHNWPDTYELPSKLESKFENANPFSLNIQQTQNIYNISHQPKSRKPTSSRYRRSKSARMRETEQILYDNHLKNIPFYVQVFTLVGFVAIIIGCIIWFSSFQDWLWAFILILIGAYGFIRTSIFSHYHKQIRDTTDFYGFSVTDRRKISHNLQTRKWGNKFVNRGSKIFIAFILEPDLNRAKQKRR